MTRLQYTLSAMFLTITACGPCEVNLVTAGDVDLCPGDGDESSGGPTSAGTGDDPTGDVCDLAPGSLWGACVDDDCPNSSVTAFCQHFATGSVCLPACGGDGCPEEVAACGDIGECLMDGTCAPTCILGAKPKCPHDDMVCDFSDLGEVCVWPHVAPTCDGIDAPGQPFAPCLADFTCDAPETICATDSNGAVCIPITSDTCAEDHQECAGPLGFGTGYGAQVDACTLECTADTDCAVAGMVCGPTFGLCLWPN